ncbi:MAG: tail protein X [Roseibium sp.]|nr:tail protein X [Roseibium sp.]
MQFDISPSGVATYVTAENDMVDLIAWNYYGRHATVAVLDANPGLAEHGPHLPAGLTITLPQLPSEPPAPTISLWD